jgi:hypothetical protein
VVSAPRDHCGWDKAVRCPKAILSSRLTTMLRLSAVYRTTLRLVSMNSTTSKYYPSIYAKGLKGTTKARDPTEIRTEYFPNTNTDRYRCTNLLI